MRLHGVGELLQVTQNRDLLGSRAQDLEHDAIWSQCLLRGIEVRELEEHPLDCKELESRGHARPGSTS